jgi:hypothetical protein
MFYVETNRTYIHSSFFFFFFREKYVFSPYILVVFYLGLYVLKSFILALEFSILYFNFDHLKYDFKFTDQL